MLQAYSKASSLPFLFSTGWIPAESDKLSLLNCNPDPIEDAQQSPVMSNQAVYRIVSLSPHFIRSDCAGSVSLTLGSPIERTRERERESISNRASQIESLTEPLLSSINDHRFYWQRNPLNSVEWFCESELVTE